METLEGAVLSVLSLGTSEGTASLYHQKIVYFVYFVCSRVRLMLYVKKCLFCLSLAKNLSVRTMDKAHGGVVKYWS